MNDLVRRGAVLSVDEDRRAAFEELGHSPKYEAREAIERATVVIDCTPVGNQMKTEFYEGATGPVGFMAQGSEYGFGKMYARGINDEALVDRRPVPPHRVVQHAQHLGARSRRWPWTPTGPTISRTASSSASDAPTTSARTTVSFRAPRSRRHKDERFGTHHARDAHGVFETMGYDLNLYSSALKLNTQYMHSIHFRSSWTAR